MSFYCVPNGDAIDHLCDVMVQDMYPWLTDDLGFSFFEGTLEGTDRHATDSAIMFYRTPEGHPGAGYEFFAALSQVAKDKGADVRLGSPITGLVQNPLTREVLGVEYSDDGGATTKTIKAKHGVIMCVGGFENSKIKQAWYNHAGIFRQCWGTPYNTGGGIDICSAVGAAMWHLEGRERSACAYRLPSEEVGCAASMPEKGYDPYAFSYFWVNKYGTRFMNEQTTMNHNIGKTPLTDWTHSKGNYPKADEYPNLPFWMVLDRNMYDKVQLYQGTGYWGLLDTYCAVQGLQPTEDWNDYALDKGLIVKADTLEELAGKMQGLNPSSEVETCDADGLKATFDAIISATEQALAAAEGGYNDGTFEGTARGIGGRVGVAATFEAGKLADFQLARLKETSGIGLDAGPLVANAILEAGTYEGVDGIAGCTVTSTAILTAAQMAFEAASGAKAYEDYLAEQEEKEGK